MGAHVCSAIKERWPLRLSQRLTRRLPVSPAHSAATQPPVQHSLRAVLKRASELNTASQLCYNFKSSEAEPISNRTARPAPLVSVAAQSRRRPAADVPVGHQ